MLSRSMPYFGLVLFCFVLFCFVLRFTIYSILRLHILPSMWDQLILETSPTNSILYNVNENQCTAPERYITEMSFRKTEPAVI